MFPVSCGGTYHAAGPSLEGTWPWKRHAYPGSRGSGAGPRGHDGSHRAGRAADGRGSRRHQLAGRVDAPPRRTARPGAARRLRRDRRPGPLPDRRGCRAARRRHAPLRRRHAVPRRRGRGQHRRRPLPAAPPTLVPAPGRPLAPRRDAARRRRSAPGPGCRACLPRPRSPEPAALRRLVGAVVPRAGHRTARRRPPRGRGRARPRPVRRRRGGRAARRATGWTRWSRRTPAARPPRRSCSPPDASACGS